MKEVGPEPVLGSPVLPGSTGEDFLGGENKWVWLLSGQTSLANIARKVSTFHSTGGTAEWQSTGAEGGGRIEQE